MANEVQILQLGDEEFKVVDAEAPRKSEIGNAEIIIKQCGVEKGRFTVNANEPVEIDLDSGYSTPIPDTDLSETAQESISKTSAIVKNGSGDLEHYAFQTSNRFGKTTLDSTSLEVEGTSGVKSKYSTSYIMKTVGDTGYRMDFPNASGTFALTDDISGKQDKLTAGSNITISGTTISATDTNTWRPLGTGANDAAAGNHDHGKNYLNVTRGKSVSTETPGCWTAMCCSDQSGSPTLPVSGQWWHILSMDWTDGDTPKDWMSQIAVATQQNNGVWWRRNNSGSSINNASWNRLAEGDSKGNANYANSAGSASSCSGNSATATTATYLARTGDTSKPMIFRWDGQGGQPTWLWGGTDGTNMYVYNPSNFNVNYASYSGRVGNDWTSLALERGFGSRAVQYRAKCWPGSSISFSGITASDDSQKYILVVSDNNSGKFYMGHLSLYKQCSLTAISSSGISVSASKNGTTLVISLGGSYYATASLTRVGVYE